MLVGCRAGTTGGAWGLRVKRWRKSGRAEERRSAEGFLALLEPLRDPLFRYARRALNREADAADVVQQAALIAWREFPRFEPGTNFRAWMFKIVVNTVFSQNKTTSRERTAGAAHDPDAREPLAQEAAWQTALADPATFFERLDDRVVRALFALSTEERQCLLLRLLEGLSYREIAEMLDEPMGTIMSHVYRARMKLRERLADMAAELGMTRGATR